ncbi:hypothetical protein DNU06_16185 [Putridiphycobacter roseus]|uniref:Uncharacterized protein n=1 Tax=Putridiphycobacter roseus TaxID=2219161 RepID=A0A2W1MXB7_9FLAO|nr:tetratricopeptide repeat protein [Putridiphycobacter roseus]PZE15810.1 hypothetical protein DNU06_16185 [Putridiphycobacter roseus]
MKKILLLLMLLPLTMFGQKEYSETATKLFEEGNVAYRAGQHDVALGLYEQCLAAEPQYVEAIVNISAVKFDQKNYVKSLDFARKAYGIEKVQYAIFSQLGKSYYMNNYFDSAVFFLERIKVFQKLSDEENYFLAAGRVKTNDFVGARKLAERLVEKAPENSDYLSLRGNVYYGLGEYEKAITDYNMALKQEPNNLYIYSNIANANLKLDRPDAALGFIDKGIQAAEGRDKVAFLILKGNYYQSVGDLDNAEKLYDEAYAIDNTNPNILVNQAGVLIDRENYQSALEKCNLAIEKNVQLMEAYYNRGIANEMLRNVEQACADWEEAFILGSEKAEKFLNSPTCNE